MLTFLEFCDKYRISHHKAKRMQRDGVLLLADETSLDLARIRETFVQGNSLGALELCAIIESPGLLEKLGRYAGRALDQVEALGDAVAGQAPRDVALYVMDAANGDADAIAALVAWIKGALPVDGSPVGYHWLAVRLMLPIAANVRPFEGDKIRRALARCRKSPEFAGWWKYQDERKSRKVTIYANPLASLDL